MDALNSSRALRQVFAQNAKRWLARAETGKTAIGHAAKQSQKRAYNSLRDELPSSPNEQADYLRRLNQRGDSEAVIRAFEGGYVASTEGALGEYVKALALVDRLDNGALIRTLQRGAQVVQRRGGSSLGSFASAPLEAAEAGGGRLSSIGAAIGLGTPKNPIHMMQAEPSMKGQAWRTVRTLGLAFLLISGLGALVDEKGMGKSMGMANSDMQPQMETNTKFEDVKGVDEAKGELEEVVNYLRDPSKYTTLGGKLPKGVLLLGPPGTGKTMLARAVAGEAGVPFFYCSGSEFEEMFVGVGARRVRDLFAAAKKKSPCIIFIDEIDAVGGSRNPKDQQYMKMTLNQLLVEMDGFKPSEGVIVIAATNFPESLDKALIRPGRFDWHVTVPNPDVRGRTEILESHFRSVPREADVNLQVIARGTPGFSGADLANLVNLAALRAARDGAPAVTQAALEHAKDRIMMGAERKSAVINEKGRRLTAYHEGGHALVALHTPGAHPVHKATIVPRGMSLGMVMQLPEEADETSVSRSQLLAKLDVCMGGRVAEELIFGEQDVTTGASSDLDQATRLARAMVTRYGMSDVLGKVSINYDDMGQSLSSETRAAVEGEVKRLLNAAYERAQVCLKKNEHELHALAKQLLEQESMTGVQIKELLERLKTQTPAPDATSVSA